MNIWLLLIVILFSLSISVFANDTSPQCPSTNTIMSPGFIITLLTSTLTILGSGVVATWISHRFAKGKEELFYKRKKLEELYKSIERYTTLLFVMNHMWLRVMDGKLTFNQGLDMQINSGSDEGKLLLPEIDMLINLYFPIFLPSYKIFINNRDMINELYQDFRNIYNVKGPTVDYSKNRNEFSKTLLEVDGISKVLLNEVAEYAQKLK